MATKAYELISQVKDICLVEGTTEDTKILRMMNLVQWDIYNTNFRWRGLEGYPTIYTTELLTLDVAPSTAWAVGDTITGATSASTCVIVEVLTTKTFNVKDRSAAFTLGEVLSNGTYTADQGTAYPTVASNSYATAPSTLAMIYDVRQTSDSPYAKLEYLNPINFHDAIPQPTAYAEGKPLYYTWWGGRLWFFPIPDATYTITIYGYLKPINMKLYTTGTSQHSGTAVTGTATYFSNNANVDTNMFYAYQADVRSDGTYPWSAITTVTDNDTLVIATYGGSSGGSAVAYACSSPTSYPEDFDLLIVYGTCIMYGGRLREFDSKLMDWLQGQYTKTLGALADTQTAIPDYTPILEDFSVSAAGYLGDSKYKYPFILKD